jgi:phenylacetate-CoA ligase
MIRYDIGDLASYKTVDGKMYLNELVGKANDLLYATDGTPTSPTMYRFFMYNYFTVKQYQIIQNTLKDFVMILNTTDHSLEADITEKMKEIFGDDMNLTFEYVDEIPKLRSGKTRISVCNIQF